MDDAKYTVIYQALHGSHAFGLQGPESDRDVKGIIVGPSSWYHGYRAAPEQIELTPEHTLYDIRKFFRLAVAANPTALELLWVDQQHRQIVTGPARLLIGARAQFLSLRVKETFSGYAMSQLRRIKGHRSWLLHPPGEKPTRAVFGLPEHSIVSRDQLGAAEALLGRGALYEAELSPNFLDVMDRERRYRSAKQQWDQYQSWLANRNPQRAQLEARFGYDTKHAQHLVRLLRMGIEILETGEVPVLRTDRDELLAIRDGQWSYGALIDYVNRLETRVQLAAEHSPLPERPDEDALNRLCARIVEMALDATLS